MHSYRGKERQVGGGPGWGCAELDLLLPWRPSPPLAAPLELFQRALLYLIKASRAAGGVPGLVLFILALLPSKCRPGILGGDGGRVNGNGRAAWDTRGKTQGPSPCPYIYLYMVFFEMCPLKLLVWTPAEPGTNTHTHTLSRKDLIEPPLWPFIFEMCPL